MIAHGVALLLLTAAVGYWVLERASNQKKELKMVGQIVGALIIAISLLGVACKIYYLATGKAACPPGMYPGKRACQAGMNCPFMPQPPSGK